MNLMIGISFTDWFENTSPNALSIWLSFRTGIRWQSLILRCWAHFAQTIVPRQTRNIWGNLTLYLLTQLNSQTVSNQTRDPILDTVPLSYTDGLHESSILHQRVHSELLTQHQNATFMQREIMHAIAPGTGTNHRSLARWPHVFGVQNTLNASMISLCEHSGGTFIKFTNSSKSITSFLFVSTASITSTSWRSSWSRPRDFIPSPNSSSSIDPLLFAQKLRALNPSILLTQPGLWEWHLAMGRVPDHSQCALQRHHCRHSRIGLFVDHHADGRRHKIRGFGRNDGVALFGLWCHEEWTRVYLRWRGHGCLQIQGLDERHLERCYHCHEMKHLFFVLSSIDDCS